MLEGGTVWLDTAEKKQDTIYEVSTFVCGMGPRRGILAATITDSYKF
jgi:hypothetical protein